MACASCGKKYPFSQNKRTTLPAAQVLVRDPNRPRLKGIIKKKPKE